MNSLKTYGDAIDELKRIETGMDGSPYRRNRSLTRRQAWGVLYKAVKEADRSRNLGSIMARNIKGLL